MSKLFLVKCWCYLSSSSDNFLSSLPSSSLQVWEQAGFFRIMTDSSNDRFLSSWHNCGRGRNKGRETESSWMGILAKKVPSTTAWKKVLTTWTDGRKTETNVSVFVKGDSCYKQTSKPKQASFNDSNRISFLLFIYTYSWMFSLPTRKCTKYWSC